MTDYLLAVSPKERIRLSPAGHGITHVTTERLCPLGGWESFDSETIVTEELLEHLSDWFDISAAELAKLGQVQ